MIRNKDKTLLLFTASFPYGEGEQFLETEINYLAKEFEKVKLIPLQTSGKERQIPANAEVIKIRIYQAYSPLKLLSKYFFKIISIYLKILWSSKDRWRYLVRFKYHFYQLLHRINDAEQLAVELSKYDKKQLVIYSYWFHLWVTMLSLYKSIHDPKLPILTRAHGADYDLAQMPVGYFMFRYFELNHVNKIVPVSAYGENYFRKNYSSYAGNVSFSRLGVNDHGDNPFITSTSFKIVSCSFLYPLKRVHLIIQILKELKFDVHWVHFGNGELLQEIVGMTKSLPSNIICEFKGLVDNKEIINYYAENPVDLFINVSELEGIPVSIMEAISFGIPVIGCDICGVPEIVTKETGFLLPKNFDVKSAAASITEYNEQQPAYKATFRRGVKLFWQKEFNASKNYELFIKKYLNL